MLCFAHSLERSKAIDEKRKEHPNKVDTRDKDSEGQKENPTSTVETDKVKETSSETPHLSEDPLDHIPEKVERAARVIRRSKPLRN